MEQEKVMHFLSLNKDYFIDGAETDQKEMVEALLEMPEENLPNITGFPFKKPATAKALAFFLGR